MIICCASRGAWVWSLHKKPGTVARVPVSTALCGRWRQVAEVSGCPYSSRSGESRKESDREGHLVHSSGTCTHTSIYHIHTYMDMYVCVHSVFKCLNSYFADEEHVKMKVSIKAPRVVGETVKIKCDIRLQNFIGGCDGLSTPCASQEQQHIQSRWKQEGTSCTSKHF